MGSCEVIETGDELCYVYVHIYFSFGGSRCLGTAWEYLI